MSINLTTWHSYMYTHTHTHTYIYIYIYRQVCAMNGFVQLLCTCNMVDREDRGRPQETWEKRRRTALIVPIYSRLYLPTSGRRNSWYCWHVISRWDGLDGRDRCSPNGRQDPNGKKKAKSKKKKLRGRRAPVGLFARVQWATGCPAWVAWTLNRRCGYGWSD